MCISYRCRLLICVSQAKMVLGGHIVRLLTSNMCVTGQSSQSCNRPKPKHESIVGNAEQSRTEVLCIWLKGRQCKEVIKMTTEHQNASRSMKVNFYRQWYDIGSIIPTRAEKLAFYEGVLSALFDADAPQWLRAEKIRLLMEGALRRIGKKFPTVTPSTSES